MRAADRPPPPSPACERRCRAVGATDEGSAHPHPRAGEGGALILTPPARSLSSRRSRKGSRGRRSGACTRAGQAATPPTPNFPRPPIARAAEPSEADQHHGPSGRLGNGQVVAKAEAVTDRARCFVPALDGAFLSSDSKDALWDRFFMGAPRRQRRSVERYSIVKRA